MPMFQFFVTGDDDFDIQTHSLSGSSGIPDNSSGIEFPSDNCNLTFISDQGTCNMAASEQQSNQPINNEQTSSNFDQSNATTDNSTPSSLALNMNCNRNKTTPFIFFDLNTSPTKKEESFDDSVNITEALLDKFSDQNFSMFGNSPVKNQNGEFQAPKCLVLDACKISSAGPFDQLCKYCNHIYDLDLADNLIHSWSEIVCILNAMPNLVHLNLTRNRGLSNALLSGIHLDDSLPPAVFNATSSQPLLAADQSDCEDHMKKKDTDPSNTLKSHNKLQSLILTNTGANLQVLAQLLPALPNLKELHLSKNHYSSLNDFKEVYHVNLKTLHLTENNITDWDHVLLVSNTFPNLVDLYLSSNELSHTNGTSFEGHFRSLKQINLAGNLLDSWDCLDKLNQIPTLTSVKLQNIPYYDTFEPSMRRNLMIARLQNVKSLNGSEIAEEQRIDAERFFIRHHSDANEECKPKRYYELVARHGVLQKLGDIDLSPTCEIMVKLSCEDIGVMEKELRVDPSITVAEFKEITSNILGVPAKRVSLFHVDPFWEIAYGREGAINELRIMSIKLSSAKVDENHEILARIETERFSHSSSNQSYSSSYVRIVEKKNNGVVKMEKVESTIAMDTETSAS